MTILALAACGAPPSGPDPYQGIVELEERVLGFEIPGRVRAIAVAEGDVVAADAELARLDDTLEQLARDARTAEARAAQADASLLVAGSRPEDIRSLQAAVAAARASEALAQQTAARQRKLSGSGIGTAADLDAAETGVATTTANRRELSARLASARHGARTQEIDAAHARVDAASAAVRLVDARIARHVLRAHSAGTVLDVHLEEGELAQPGTAVVTLGDVQRPHVDVFVPQARAGELVVGQAVTVRTDGAGPFPATIEHIARQTEFTPKFMFSPTERPNLVIRVRVRIDAQNGDLPAGVPAFVTTEEPA